MPMYRCCFCEHANPLAAKFCNECGSPLNLKPCPQCDAVNGATSKACYMCGAFFPIRGAEPEAPETARSILETYTAESPHVSPDRRPAFAGVMATLLPVVVLGAIAIAAYFVGYQQTGREWLAGAWASLASNRDVVATPAAPPTTSLPITPASPANNDAAQVAAAKPASLTESAPPTDTTTASPNHVSVPPSGDTGSANATPPPTQAIVPVASPAKVATVEHATPAATAVHSEKKSSTGNKKTAKKPKSTTTKKAAPAQPNAAP